MHRPIFLSQSVATSLSQERLSLTPEKAQIQQIHPDDISQIKCVFHVRYASTQAPFISLPKSKTTPQTHLNTQQVCHYIALYVYKEYHYNLSGGLRDY